MYELKDSMIDTQLTIKKKECRFMNERIKMIENKNSEMKLLIEKSTKMAKEITSLLKKIYSKNNRFYSYKPKDILYSEGHQKD